MTKCDISLWMQFDYMSVHEVLRIRLKQHSENEFLTQDELENQPVLFCHLLQHISSFMIPWLVGSDTLLFLIHFSPGAKKMVRFCVFQRISVKKNPRNLKCFFLRDGLANSFNQHPDFTSEKEKNPLKG